MTDPFPAVTRGNQAVAEVLANAGSVLWNTPEDAMELAVNAIDAWCKASNPWNGTETIYDDFYRLRAVARTALEAYDAGGSASDAMEALRAALLSGEYLDPKFRS